MSVDISNICASMEFFGFGKTKNNPHKVELTSEQEAVVYLRKAAKDI